MRSQQIDGADASVSQIDYFVTFCCRRPYVKRHSAGDGTSQNVPKVRSFRCPGRDTTTPATSLSQRLLRYARLRTDKTKGCGSRAATLTMVFKLAESAQRRFRRLHGHELIGDVVVGIRFKDGEKQAA